MHNNENVAHQTDNHIQMFKTRSKQSHVLGRRKKSNLSLMGYQEWVDIIHKYQRSPPGYTLNLASVDLYRTSSCLQHVHKYTILFGRPLTLTYCPAKSTTSAVKQPEASTGQMGTWSLWMMLYSIHTLKSSYIRKYRFKNI